MTNDFLEAALGELKAQRENSDSEIKLLKDQGEKLGLFTNPKIISNAENASDIALIGQSITSANALDISDKLIELTETATTGTLEERKAADKEVRFLKEISTTVADPEDRRLLEKQFDLMNQSLATNSNTLDNILKVSGTLAPAIAGVTAAAFSENPALGLLVAGVGKFGKDQISGFIERKKIEKETKENLILEKKAVLEKEIADNAILEKETILAEKQEASAEREVSNTDALALIQSNTDETNSILSDSSLTASSDNSDSASSDNSDSASSDNSDSASSDLLKESLESQEETNNLIKEGNEPDLFAKENAKESEIAADNRFDKLTSALSAVGAGEEAPTGIFDSIFKSFKNFKGMMVGLGAKLMSFAPMFKGFLKKIPIIGPIVFGGVEIFKGLSELPDGADMITKVLTVMKGAGEGILDFFLGIPVWIVDSIFDTDIAGFIEEGGGFTQVIADAIGSVFSGIADAISSVIDTVSSMIDMLIPDFLKSDTPEEQKIKEQQDLDEDIKDQQQSLKESKASKADGGIFSDDASDVAEEQAKLDALLLKRDSLTTTDSVSNSILSSSIPDAMLSPEYDNASSPSVDREKARITLSSEAPVSTSSGNVSVVNAPSTTNINNVAESKVFIKPTTQNSQRPLREDFALSY